MKTWDKESPSSDLSKSERVSIWIIGRPGKCWHKLPSRGGMLLVRGHLLRLQMTFSVAGSLIFILVNRIRGNHFHLL